MNTLWEIIWQRFNLIMAAVSDANARAIAVIFYFTILVPFGIGSNLFSDPLRRKVTRDPSGNERHSGMAWFDRDPVPTDINSARQQG